MVSSSSYIIHSDECHAEEIKHLENATVSEVWWLKHGLHYAVMLSMNYNSITLHAV